MIFSILIYLCNIICSLLYDFFKKCLFYLAVIYLFSLMLRMQPYLFVFALLVVRQTIEYLQLKKVNVFTLLIFLKIRLCSYIC